MTAALTEAVAQSLNTELMHLTVLVTSPHGCRWMRFTGETTTWLDARIAAYLSKNPHLSIDLDSPAVCWSHLPQTFEAVIAR